MKKLISALAAAITSAAFLFAPSALSQPFSSTAHRLDQPYTFAAIAAPSGATSGCVGFFLGTPLRLTCDSGLAYDAATDTLTTTNLANATAVRAGTGTATARVGGVLHVSTTSQATTGTSEQVLATYTLPANTLSADGKAIRISAVGQCAANSNSKTVRLRVGGIAGAIPGQIVTTSSSGAVYISVTVIRTGAAAWTTQGAGIGGSSALAQYGAGSSTTWANAQDIVVTGTTPTSAGDFTFHSLIVEALN